MLANKQLASWVQATVNRDKTIVDIGSFVKKIVTVFYRIEVLRDLSIAKQRNIFGKYARWQISCVDVATVLTAS